jgi:hypothetical protein
MPRELASLGVKGLPSWTRQLLQFELHRGAESLGLLVPCIPRSIRTGDNVSEFCKRGVQLPRTRLLAKHASESHSWRLLRFVRNQAASELTYAAESVR